MLLGLWAKMDRKGWADGQIDKQKEGRKGRQVGGLTGEFPLAVWTGDRIQESVVRCLKWCQLHGLSSSDKFHCHLIEQNSCKIAVGKHKHVHSNKLHNQLIWFISTLLGHIKQQKIHFELDSICDFYIFYILHTYIFQLSKSNQIMEQVVEFECCPYIFACRLVRYTLLHFPMGSVLAHSLFSSIPVY